jgi:hypothetical protein
MLPFYQKTSFLAKVVVADHCFVTVEQPSTCEGNGRKKFDPASVRCVLYPRQDEATRLWRAGSDADLELAKVPGEASPGLEVWRQAQ